MESVISDDYLFQADGAEAGSELRSQTDFTLNPVMITCMFFSRRTIESDGYFLSHRTQL